jgi:hypothetical protein
MPNSEDDFWPSLEIEGDITPPVKILRSQASALGTKTRYQIKAEVATDAVGEEFVHRFNLIVPRLGDYTYELFYIRHEMSLYPVEGVVANIGTTLDAEADFLKWLKDTLSSERTRQVLSALLAQVSP